MSNTKLRQKHRKYFGQSAVLLLYYRVDTGKMSGLHQYKSRVLFLFSVWSVLLSDPSPPIASKRASQDTDEVHQASNAQLLYLEVITSRSLSFSKTVRCIQRGMRSSPLHTIGR